MKVTLVPVVIAAASSSVMNSGLEDDLAAIGVRSSSDIECSF
jgi:hypothetical protein